MIVTTGYCATMARYNLWQNRSVVGAASTLSDAARREDMGAFFGSIAGTLSHILWADGYWMSRFTGSARPKGGIAESPTLHPEWEAFTAARLAMDICILDWADALSDENLEGELVWYSRALKHETARPVTVCVMHFFNHQTHHRGQVHAMLTALGVIWGDTDLIYMPEEIGA